MNDLADSIHSEEDSPLLEPSYRQPEVLHPTPVRKFQIGIVLLLQLTEAITSRSIYPYINQLVGELDITGGDKKKVGYYTGLIQSLFYVTESITVLQWNRVSDHIGRKPVMLIGLFGTALSMLCFGLSRTFWTLVISRCLCAFLSGNIGVIKSVVGELTDTSNRAEIFAWAHVIWAIGMAIGFSMGGSLARPFERFPSLFTNPFWEQYPYFLPCLAASGVAVVTFVVIAWWFEETVPKASLLRLFRTSSSSYRKDSENLKPQLEGPLPLRQILVYPVILSISNYMSLAFLNISATTLLPLFFAMPVEIGGLSFSPPAIGYIMGSYGASSAVFQALFLAKVIRLFGEKRVFICAMSTFVPIFTLIPIMSLVAKNWGIGFMVYVLVACVVALLTLMDMAFGCVFLFITSSAPNKRSLGTTNGLSQTTVSIARAIAPALSNSLFSFSVQHDILWGYGAYAALCVFSFMALLLAVQLPRKNWKEHEELYVIEEIEETPTI